MFLRQRFLNILNKKGHQNIPEAFSYQTHESKQLHLPNLITTCPPPPQGGVFLELGITAKRVTVDAYELVGGRGGREERERKKEREVVTTVA